MTGLRTPANQRGDKIRKARKARGWTQAELADHARIAQTLVGLAERGQHATATTLKAIMFAMPEVDLDLSEVGGGHPSGGGPTSIVGALLGAPWSEVSSTAQTLASLTSRPEDEEVFVSIVARARDSGRLGNDHMRRARQALAPRYREIGPERYEDAVRDLAARFARDAEQTATEGELSNEVG